MVANRNKASKHVSDKGTVHYRTTQRVGEMWQVPVVSQDDAVAPTDVLNKGGVRKEGVD